MRLWPDHETDTDLVGFSYIADAVVTLASADHLLPATIGVFGDWGSGKSSLISMIRRKLDGNEGTLVVEFNGWLFEGYDDAKSALMGTIIDEVITRRSAGQKAKTLAVNLLRRIDWFRAAGGALRFGIRYAAALSAAGPSGVGVAAGLDATEALDRASQVLADASDKKLNSLSESETAHTLRRGIREFRGDFDKFLKESNVDRLIVIIDDLDRCLPDTIIETLEAIKLFLFVPRTAFVIGADERLVEYAVKQRFPELQGSKSEVGRDYLEKLIQYPVRIPPLGRAEMETYISLLFTEASGVDRELLSKARAKALERTGTDVDLSFGIEEVEDAIGHVPQALRESLAISARIAPLLARGLNGNPRQCKRFLNAFTLRLEMARLRGITLEQRILVKLMLLERFRPESFRQLAGWQAAQKGRPEQLEIIEMSSRGAAQKRRSSVAENEDSEDEPRKGIVQHTELTMDLRSWSTDPVMAEWVELEPALSNVDLRPYFYISRDLLGPISSLSEDMSRAARSTVEKLLDPSEAVRTKALERAASLSEMDAAMVLEALTSRIRLEEDHGAGTSALSRLFEWGEARPELQGHVVTALKGLLEESLPIATPLKLINMCRGTQLESLAWELINRWAGSSNARLGTAAKNVLRKNE